MGVVPKLKSSCFCCSLKTGSFVTAWLLLVGSSVQTGFYAFLVDHMNLQKICTEEETIWIEEPLSARDYYPYQDSFFWLNDGYYPLPKKGKPHYRDAVNNTHRDVSNKSYAANTTGNSNHTAQHAANTTTGQQTASIYAANATDRVPTNSSPADSSNSTDTFLGLSDKYHSLPKKGKPHYQDAVNNTHRDVSNKSYAANTTGISNHTAQHAANTTTGQQTDYSYAANTTGRVPTNSSSADSSNSTAGDRRRSQRRRRRWNSILGLGSPTLRSETRLKEMRCSRRRYLPFDADSDFLDFEVTSPIDKTILYVNIVIWAVLMAGTTVLMAAVYKEWATLVCAWLLWEGLLLTVATAAAVAASVLMFRTVAVQIGVVTLLNMALHLGINIYLMMVVENYRQKLTNKEDDDEEEQVIV